MAYEHFIAALRQLGKSDKERAQQLGVNEFTAKRYRNGELPKVLEVLTRQPSLLLALAQDAEALKATRPSNLS